MVNGYRVVGENRFLETPAKLNHHMADKNGRMYWCNCMRGIRFKDKPKLCLGGRWIKTFKNKF